MLSNTFRGSNPVRTVVGRRILKEFEANHRLREDAPNTYPHVSCYTVNIGHPYSWVDHVVANGPGRPTRKTSLRYNTADYTD